MDSIQLHGLNQVAAAKTAMRKGLWLGVLLGMFLGFVYNTYVSLSNYMSDPVVTSISVQTYSSLPYPTLLICPFDFIKDPSKGQFDSVIQHLNSPYILKEGIGRNTAQLRTGLNVSMTTNYSDRPTITRGELERNLHKMAYAPSDIFLKCQFDSVPVICNQYLRTTIPSVQSGVCFLLEPTDKRQMHHGRGIMLYLNLFIKDNFTMFPFDGLSLHIGINEEMAAIASPLLVDVGSYVKVDLGLKQTIVVPTSSSPCKDASKSTLSHFYAPHETRYTQSTCQERRRRAFYAEHCGCLSWQHWLPATHDTAHLPVCTLAQIRDCSRSNRTLYDAAIRKVPCYIPCEWWSVFTQENAIQLKQESKLLKENFNSTRGRLVILDISYKDLQVETIQQKNAITFNTLMSNVGGLLGLWLGASAFTIIQLALYFGRVSTQVLVRSGRIESQQTQETLKTTATSSTLSHTFALEETA